MSRGQQLSLSRNLLASVFFIGGLLVLIPEIEPLENTLGGTRLLMVAFLLGTALGAVAGFNPMRSSAARTTSASERLGFVICVALGTGFLTAAAGSHWNRTGSHEPDRTLELEVTRKEVSQSRNGPSHYIWVRWKNGDERLRFNSGDWSRVREGRPVHLIVTPGALGAPVVAGLDARFGR